MLNNNKVVIVMPSYNAEATLADTYAEIPFDIVDSVILVDDDSYDNTTDVAHSLGIEHIIRHDRNRGYGANQKTCYSKALEIGADIVIMLHPDYQYTPKLVTAMASLIAYDVYDCVLGSRILSRGALEGGMPVYKYVANRFLTTFQNLVANHHLSEYHTGYRAFSRQTLCRINTSLNSDNFLFDNQMLVQIIATGQRIGEVSCPTHYADDSSSISLSSSTVYGLGVLYTCAEYLMHRTGLKKHPRYVPVEHAPV